ncbi:Succinylglutamate desuccinylase [Pseudidiomarina piscicola]|uniref:Succinylglutamate desuccinylase n=1 Tax=Pseudidiomarina piscicola TaxID=2614830 RepID=A0A6S6WR15_9GAMM|nr:succinylglutamate desuccinylase [Pseudidiomarina piscicola]CAB0150330.1 Succinylglutamate desuccinylase [Pseudidiomarina piscicola]VZT39758.1 Succinylglutamate desuccinylase [Pseudomonas aeruginosa]
MKLNEVDVLQWTLAGATGQQLSADQQLLNKRLDYAGGQIIFNDYGVVTVEPTSPGDKDVVYSCAVHGDETAPIEIVRDMIHGIMQGQIKPVQRTLFLIANPAAIAINKRFVEMNMNRLFSGAHRQGDSPEHHRAAAIEGYVTEFFNSAPNGERRRLHYDLHTAIRDSKYEKFAVYPFTHGGPYKKEQLTFLAECGVTTILLNQAPTTTFSYYSVRTHQADAFTVELGKVRPFGENNRHDFAAAETMFTRLICEHDLALPNFDPDRTKIFDVCRTINRTNEKFVLHFPDDVANFTAFAEGDLLATDGDTEYRVEQAGERIIFPNAKVALDQRALLTVIDVPITGLQLV